jgi:hypothetical protein
MTSPVNPFNPTNDPFIQTGGTSGPMISDSLEFFTDPANVEVPKDGMSYNFLSKMMSGSSLTLAAQIKEALQRDAEMTLAFFKFLAETSSELLNLYYVKEADYRSKTMDKERTGPAIELINTKNIEMQTAIDNLQTASTEFAAATNEYQIAVNTYNISPNSTPEERAAALDAYNNARLAYNDAVTQYNSVVTATNQAVASYRAAVDAYQNLITTIVNPDIDVANDQRGNLPKLTQQTVPTDHATWTYADATLADPLSPVILATPPAQNQPAPPPPPVIPTPPPFALPIVDPRTLVFTDSMKEFTDAAIKFFGINAAQVQILTNLRDDRVLTGLDYLKRIRLSPEADVKDFDPQVSVSPGSPGGLGMASFALKINPVTADAVLSEALAKQPFIQEMATIPTELYSHLLTLTLSTALQTANLASFPGVAYLNGYLGSLPPNSPAVGIAAALGYNTTLIGLLNSQGLLISIQNVLGNIPSLANLTALQQAALAGALSALVSDALLRISVNALATQLHTPAVEDALKVAALVANPTAKGGVYATLGEKLAALGKEYGAATVAAPLSELLRGKLSGAGLSSEQAAQIAERVAAFATTQGLGEDVTALQNLDLGVDVSADARALIFEGVVTFAAAASLKQEVQASLIGQAGATQAINLSDNIVKGLYGFSVDISQGTISAQETIDNRPMSVVQIATDNQRTLLKTSSQELLDAAQNRFTYARQEDVSLEAFQRVILDPGVKLFGLMYDGAKGTSFERKSVDIKVA